MNRRVVVTGCLGLLLAAGQVGLAGSADSPDRPEDKISTRLVTIADGDDWSLPSWVEATAGTGVPRVSGGVGCEGRFIELPWLRSRPSFVMSDLR